MATRKPSCTEWHQRQGKWMRTLGNRGCRIRLFQKRRGGNFYREVWQGNRSHKKCLFTADKTQAEEIGKKLFASLISGRALPVKQEVLLSELCRKYRLESPDYLDNKENTRKSDARRMEFLCGFFGRDRNVLSLTASDQADYCKKRLAGGIVYYRDNKMYKTAPCRTRSVQADLVVLHQMLRWATTIRLINQQRWLEYHPLQGVKLPSEKNPKRPVATWDRFDVACKKLQELQTQEDKSDRDRQRYTYLELALILVEATGRRIGSVRQLRWEDMDFSKQLIHWRAEADKKGQEWSVPMPDVLADSLKHFRRRLGVVGGWVFPAPKDVSAPMDRYLLDHWLRAFEIDAKLSKLDGGLWHPYRRKWATERKDRPLKDVAAAGGWKDVNTLLRCYQHADADTMLAVMSEPKKLRDKQSVG